MKRHRLDATSLVFGLVFLTVVGWWFARRSIDVGLPVLAWVMAVALIAVGGAGLIGVLRGGRQPDRQPDRDGDTPLPGRPEPTDHPEPGDRPAAGD